MEAQELVGQVRVLVDDVAALSRTGDALRALQSVANVVAAAQARLARQLADRSEFEDDGYASAKSWLRGELRLDTRPVHDLVSAGATLADLPELDTVARGGGVSLDHVRHFSYGLKHAGEPATREFLDELIEVATTAEPGNLRTVVRHLREAVYPDALDQAWIDGMAREDIQLNPVPDGWHVNGFLNSTVGAKFNTLLQSLSMPAGANDPRPGAQRRVDGLERLLDQVLRNGLPGDRGVRPHVQVTIDVEALRDGQGAGQLVGFGRVGLRQVTDLICGADITPVVIRPGDGSVLDVGRTFRLATKRQRVAVEVRQNHRCAAPGCAAPIVDIHHIVWWSHGGATNLDNLIGLCPRCHRAVHAGTMIIDPDSYQFKSRRGLLLRHRDPHCQSYRRRLRTRRLAEAQYRAVRARSG